MSPHDEKADALTPAEPLESDWLYKLGRRDLCARNDDFRFRLNVVAPTVADVVSCVGGWLVDRAMLGWEITVLIAARQQDLRPLHILGVTPLAFDEVLNGRRRLPICDGISVAADLYFGDARVRRHVLRRLHWGQSEFTLWGADWPVTPDEDASASMAAITVEHRLTVAARSFKAHALAAALGSAAERVATPTETFCDGRFRDGFRQSPLRVVPRAGNDIDVDLKVVELCQYTVPRR
jgi:hypothetical protein